MQFFPLFSVDVNQFQCDSFVCILVFLCCNFFASKFFALAFLTGSKWREETDQIRSSSRLGTPKHCPCSTSKPAPRNITENLIVWWIDIGVAIYVAILDIQIVKHWTWVWISAIVVCLCTCWLISVQYTCCDVETALIGYHMAMDLMQTTTNLRYNFPINHIDLHTSLAPAIQM